MLLGRLFMRFSGRQRRLGAALSIASVIALIGVWRIVFRPLEQDRREDTGPTVAPVRAAPRPTQPISFSQDCTTAECHATHPDAAVPHPSVTSGSCGECHQPDAGNHTFPLIGPASEICGKCHDMGARHPVQHKAMTDDGCLACHGPHGGSTAALLVRETSNRTCAECHAVAHGLIRHEPYANDRCEVCHDVHGSSTRQLLRVEVIEESCRPCHAEEVRAFESGKHSHRGVQRACVGCHSPHAGDGESLLAMPARALCVACHAEIEARITHDEVSHDSVLRIQPCTRCHDPHASEEPGMLREAETLLCLSCHAEPITAKNGRTIEAMRDPSGMRDNVRGHRACADCHTVHGGTRTRHATDRLAGVGLHPEDQRDYALCFTCHDARLVDEPLATQFRDGTRNLHEAHMATGARTRGCGACHDVHSLGQVRLIAEFVTFGDTRWTTPMGFALTDDGGRCGPGCHEAMEYRRDSGGVNAKKGMGVP